jgi:protein-tyrosine-phosphatase
MKHIVVVCRGNIARSPFAEAIIKQELAKYKRADEYEVVSRGTQGTAIDPVPVKFPNITYYEQLYKDAKPTLDKFGVDLSAHISKPIDGAIVEEADIILALDNKTKTALVKLFRGQTAKIHLLYELVGQSQDIKDPEVLSGEQAQAQVFTEVRNVLIEGMPNLFKIVES